MNSFNSNVALILVTILICSYYCSAASVKRSAYGINDTANGLVETAKNAIIGNNDQSTASKKNDKAANSDDDDDGDTSSNSPDNDDPANSDMGDAGIIASIKDGVKGAIGAMGAIDAMGVMMGNYDNKTSNSKDGDNNDDKPDSQIGKPNITLDDGSSSDSQTTQMKPRTKRQVDYIALLTGIPGFGTYLSLILYLLELLYGSPIMQ